MIKNEYFKCRDGSLYTKHTKQEIRNLINPYDFNTIEPFLKEMDYPAIKGEYCRLLNYHKNQPSTVFGRYISLMRLAVFRSIGYEDWLKKSMS